MLMLDEMMGEGVVETYPVGEGVHHYRLKGKGAEDEPEGDVAAELEQTGLFGGTTAAEGAAE